MNNLQDIINLAKIDGGKFFVIDETGEAKLVILPMEEYQRLLLGKLQKQIVDVENINREIIKAQLDEWKASGAQPRSERSSATGVNREILKSQLQEDRPVVPVPQQVHHTLAVKGPKVTHAPAFPRVDLRAEVIDPSFDFEAPRVEIDDL
ncbi:MAG: hypothetical protein AAB729_01830 [Patescibacteria group bacterium]